ncbi:30S ribosomal protein S14 [Balneolaceae bacterium YR4-1]|uniref:Small ribosomal subunit protein uS14 n=1 Tax=Halalkalibaculum roseum TaxID=2709311 RepID=A0A6M1SYJ4_9BACT|nr:30S ribosomal protein S14 [Halalkalibaculum roseum]MDX1585221.1 30S ribosomal protein S14 [Balneolaceae bacterium]NGP78170.1 30S ribosomal protein S14 [Halalkalibaculum roseum]
MAKKAWIARNKKRRETVKKYAEKRRKLKEEGKYEELQKLPRDASPTRLNNRCSLTGRSRGYIRKYGISRIKFRELALDGKIPGVRKASW